MTSLKHKHSTVPATRPVPARTVVPGRPACPTRSDASTLAKMNAPTRLLYATLLLVALAFTGCTEPALRGDRTRIAAAEYDRTFTAAVDVLHRERLGVDRQDYRFGVITSHARPSPTLIEVWDSANSTFYQAVESTFNDQRRVVRVTLEPVHAPDATDAPADANGPATNDTPDQYTLRVEAIIERLQNPQYHLSGSTQGHRSIEPVRTVPDELQRRGIDGPYWRTVGRDPYLEERLLKASVAAATEPLPDALHEHEPAAP
mgnify:CR=1 FL=1